MFDSVRPHRRQPTRLPRPWDSPGKNTGVGCHFLLQCMKVKSQREVAQSCPTLSDPMDCSLPGFSVHGFSRQEYWSGVPLPSLWVVHRWREIISRTHCLGIISQHRSEANGDAKWTKTQIKSQIVIFINSVSKSNVSSNILESQIVL